VDGPGGPPVNALRHAVDLTLGNNVVNRGNYERLLQAIRSELCNYCTATQCRRMAIPLFLSAIVQVSAGVALVEEHSTVAGSCQALRLLDDLRSRVAHCASLNWRERGRDRNARPLVSCGLDAYRSEDVPGSAY